MAKIDQPADPLAADLSFELAACLDFDAIEPEAENRKPRATTAELTGGRTVTTQAATRASFALDEVVEAAKFLDRLPAQDETRHAIKGQEFVLGDIVPAFRILAGSKISELIITTLSFSHSNIATLCRMLDAGEVLRLTLLISEYSKNIGKDIYAEALEQLQARGQTLVAARSHCKVLLFAFEDGRRFVIETSANLRSCQSLEQVTVTQSAELYDFHAGWIRRLIAATPQK